MWPGCGHCHSPLYLSSHPHGPEGPGSLPQPAAPQWPRAGDPAALHCTVSFSGSQESGAPTPIQRQSRHQVKETPSWAPAPRGLRGPALLRVHVAVPEEATFWMTHGGHTLFPALVTRLQPGRRGGLRGSRAGVMMGEHVGFCAFQPWNLALPGDPSRQRLTRGVTAQGGRLPPGPQAGAEPRV